MQKCGYCGRANEDDAAHCAGCGTDLRPCEPEECPISPKTPTRVFVVVLALLWTSAIALFVIHGYYGFYEPAWLGREFIASERSKSAVVWGAFGLCLASSAAVGVFLARAVRWRQVGLPLGLLLLAGSCLLCAIFMPVALEANKRFALIEFRGADGWGIFYLWALSILWSCLAFAVFTVILVWASRRACSHESN